MEPEAQSKEPHSSSELQQRTDGWFITILRCLSALIAALSALVVLLFDKEFWPFIIAVLSLGLLTAWFACRGHVRRDRILILCGGATGLLLGFIGLVCGVVWANHTNPDSNLNALFGIFYTGPAGFAMGATLGIFLSQTYFDLEHHKHHHAHHHEHDPA